MKTKQTKIDRAGAKLLPGAMALAATAASSQAATVQITLAGNKISSTGGNQLNADLTGDLLDDVVLGAVGVGDRSVFANVNGGQVYGSFNGMFVYFIAHANFGSGVGGGFEKASSPVESRALNPITFTDSRVNGGVATQAWLEVWVYNTSTTEHAAEFTRVIFDDASTTRPSFSSIPGAQTEWVQVSAIPEPGGFVATSLLLGAAGLIRRRQMRAA